MKTLIAYTVQRWFQAGWCYLTETGGWSADIQDAKTWTRIAYADRASFKHPGSVVVPHNVG